MNLLKRTLISVGPSSPSSSTHPGEAMRRALAKELDPMDVAITVLQAEQTWPMFKEEAPMILDAQLTYFYKIK